MLLHNKKNRSMDRDILALISYFTYRLFFDSQRSSDIQLTANTKYYMEIIGREIEGGDFFIAGVIFPNGVELVPITYQYLEPFY